MAVSVRIRMVPAVLPAGMRRSQPLGCCRVAVAAADSHTHKRCWALMVLLRNAPYQLDADRLCEEADCGKRLLCADGFCWVHCHVRCAHPVSDARKKGRRRGAIHNRKENT